MALLRRVLGETLRGQRQRQHRTLREVSAAARVSLGYLSEVERGQKEASSELLGAICYALDLRLWDLLREVSDTMRQTETSAGPVPVGAAGRQQGLGPIRRVSAVGADSAEEAYTADGYGARRPEVEPAVAEEMVTAPGTAGQAAIRRTTVAQPILEPVGGDSREVLDSVLRRVDASGVIAA
jgi:transcriptional regulator with XRE-family HTH domain